MTKLIVLTGPTAAGKSKLAVRMAKELSGEIISADSMQVYRHMDIGTDKIKPEEMQGVPHHLIDILEPTEPFNVTRFQSLALQAIDEITARGHVPMLVGGTGFYIQAVLYRIDFTETDDDPVIRQFYEEKVRQRGGDAVMELYEKLKEVDPVSAMKISPHNVKRVIRALEFFQKTGLPISEHNARERAKSSPFDFRYFVLTDERSVLYDRINRRVDQMMEEGLVDEVRALKERGVTKEMTSMQGLGYREVFAHLDGACDLSRTTELIKRNTRHFAKRQMTWFRREKEVRFFDRRAFAREDDLYREMMSQCR